MEKNQVDERSHTTTDTESKQNPNEEFNGKQTATNEPEVKKEDKETEVPGIGDDNEIESDEITMGSQDIANKEEDKEEASEEEPINGKPDERKIGDSDAAPVVNRTENEVVNS